MIIDFRLEIFKVEGKRYIICSNHEILFMLFRPLVLYLKSVANNFNNYTDGHKTDCYRGAWLFMVATSCPTVPGLPLASGQARTLIRNVLYLDK